MIVYRSRRRIGKRGDTNHYGKRNQGLIKNRNHEERYGIKR